MSRQDRKPEKRKDAGKKDDETAPVDKAVEKGKALKDDLDKLMDEIDDVLEENAEEFVKNYVQKGGE